MAKASSSKRLNVDYLVLQCSAPAGIVNLGVLGTVRLMPKVGMLFFVGNPPKKINGLDPFEMKLVSAAPNAVREDLNQLTSQSISPEITGRSVSAISRNGFCVQAHLQRIARIRKYYVSYESEADICASHGRDFETSRE